MPIFSWSALVFGSIATEMTGIGITIFSRVIDLLEIAQRVAGVHVLEAHGRGDVAGAHFLDLAALVGVHLQQTSDAFLLVLGGHVHRVAGVQRAGVDAEEGEIADERIVEDLERQRGERFLVGAVRVMASPSSRTYPWWAACRWATA